MSLEDISHNSTNVIQFKDYIKPVEETITTTSQKSSEIIDNSENLLNKSDIVAAMIMCYNGDIDQYTADDMMKLNYYDLYEKMLDMIVDNLYPIYSSLWFNVEYNKDDFYIYLEKDWKISKLDINLIPTKDFSDITIKILYKWELLFLANSQTTWRVDILPEDIDTLEEQDIYFQNISEKERVLIQKNTSTKNMMISSIITNFSDYIVSETDMIDVLSTYTRYQLMHLLAAVICTKYWEQHNIILNPFCPLLLQKANSKNLENISYKLNLNENNYETSIDIYNESWNLLFTVNKD